MKDRHPLVLVALLGLALAAGWACQSEDTAADAQRQAAWSELETMKSELDAARARLAELKQQAETDSDTAEAAAADGEAAQSEAAGSQEMPAANAGVTAAELAETEEQVQEQADEFNRKLVEFINADPIVEGTEPTPTQRAALDMYVEENMAIAREFIEKGGDYRQAIQIYQQALRIEPDNVALQQALAEAEANRYMTEERFARVEEGMTEDEVRDALGQVNLRNRRSYDDGARSAWFYVREQDGYAAGVFFERQDDGSYTVYASDFDAVTPQKTQEQAAQ